ncbi:MAG: PP2C family serine/threonine-protein phosphatase [Candidatus Methylacidiphilales bacterium]
MPTSTPSPSPSSGPGHSAIPRVAGAALTHPGRVRAGNEDALYFGLLQAGLKQEEPSLHELPAGEPWLLLVADGMGGHLAGERASREVVDSLSQVAPLTPPVIETALRDANRALIQAGQQDPTCAGMGATIAGLAWGPEGLFAFSVGDARIYRRQDQFLSQISRDDSVAEVLVAAGHISRDDVRPNTMHALTQSVGGRTHFADIRPHIYPLKLQGPGRFLLCTDGLTDTLTLDEIEEIINTSREPRTAVSRLFSATWDGGAKDNITLIVVDIDGAGDGGQTDENAGDSARKEQTSREEKDALSPGFGDD